ncbi:AAA family ATPase [Candidatus Phytoplasma pruni]|uniref:AAA family ATPase n=1 Tax=Candidatus Phytoplasma pruni TaxID=479893 RepID=A0A851HHD6_9MOLU|nr:AAA family ATPase [Candidatus Phytoplasma pruni]NWN46010.1 AAA family ATPase [Candidatus Phytoplasma pruni]
MKQKKLTNKKQFLLLLSVSLLFLLIVFSLTLIGAAKNPNQTSSTNNKQSLNNNRNNNKPVKSSGSGNNSALVEALSPPDFNWGSFPDWGKVYGMKTQKAQLEKVIHRFQLENKSNYTLRNEDRKEAVVQPDGKTQIQVVEEWKEEIAHPKGTIFYGPPGTGKTYLAKAFAKKAEMSFYTLTPDSTTEEIKKVFSKAKTNSPSIIFVDEAEEVLKERTLPNISAAQNVKTCLFLSELDGVGTDPDRPFYFIAATNHLNTIDDAIRSRLDQTYVGYLKKEERLGFLKIISGKLDMDPLAKKYLEVIVAKLNRAMEIPDKFAKAITDKGYKMDALGVIEEQGALEPSEFGDTRTPEEKERKKLHDLTERVKKHFYLLGSNRKLTHLIDKAAANAGFHGHGQILISDLEEALAELIGNSSEYLGAINDEDFTKLHIRSNNNNQPNNN